MASSQIRIKGQAELERAFLQVRREVLAELRPALREIGEVVRVSAQAKAGSEIRNIGPTWERMRLGVTLKGVYVAPRTRPSGGSPRPNLAGLLMDKAMQPALDENEAVVMARLGLLVDEASRRGGF